jgi:hypothetical protein
MAEKTSNMKFEVLAVVKMSMLALNMEAACCFETLVSTEKSTALQARKPTPLKYGVYPVD